MIADGRNYPRSDPWVAILPGIAVLIVAMAGNFPGDRLRDRFRPSNAPDVRPEPTAGITGEPALR